MKLVNLLLLSMSLLLLMGCGNRGATKDAPTATPVEDGDAVIPEVEEIVAEVEEDPACDAVPESCDGDRDCLVQKHKCLVASAGAASDTQTVTCTQGDDSKTYTLTEYEGSAGVNSLLCDLTVTDLEGPVLFAVNVRSSCADRLEAEKTSSENAGYSCSEDGAAEEATE